MFTRKEMLFLQLVNSLLLLIGVTILQANPVVASAFAASTFVFWLFITLVPPRLVNLPTLEKAKPVLLPIARNGKWLGIWTALWFVAWLFADVVVLGVWPSWLAYVCLAILAVLVAISNKWSYANLKWWKHISMSVWVIPPLVFALLAGSRLDLPLRFGLLGAILVIFAIAALPFFAGKQDYFAKIRVGWLSLGSLIGLAASFLA